MKPPTIPPPSTAIFRSCIAACPFDTPGGRGREDSRSGRARAAPSAGGRAGAGRGSRAAAGRDAARRVLRGEGGPTWRSGPGRGRYPWPGRAGRRLLARPAPARPRSPRRRRGRRRAVAPRPPRRPRPRPRRPRRGAPAASAPAAGWIVLDYRPLVDLRQPTHSGEPVGLVLERLGGRPRPVGGSLRATSTDAGDAADHSLVDPLLEPYGFVLADAVDAAAATGAGAPAFVEIGDLFPPGAAEPAWVELVRARRYLLESDGQGRLRAFVPWSAGEAGGDGARVPAVDEVEAAKSAWAEAWPVVRHALAAERRRVGKPLTIEVRAYAHFPARTRFLLGARPHRVSVDAVRPDGRRPPLDLVAWQRFLDQGLTLEGARLDPDGAITLFGSPAAVKPSILGRPLSLADAAVAYRAVFHGGAAEPYMSLDRGFAPQLALVNYGGRLRDTGLGMVSLLCDARFKTFSLGDRHRRGVRRALARACRGARFPDPPRALRRRPRLEGALRPADEALVLSRHGRADALGGRRPAGDAPRADGRGFREGPARHGRRRRSGRALDEGHRRRDQSRLRRPGASLPGDGRSRPGGALAVALHLAARGGAGRPGRARARRVARDRAAGDADAPALPAAAGLQRGTGEAGAGCGRRLRAGRCRRRTRSARAAERPATRGSGALPPRAGRAGPARPAAGRAGGGAGRAERGGGERHRAGRRGLPRRAAADAPAGARDAARGRSREAARARPGRRHAARLQRRDRRARPWNGFFPGAGRGAERRADRARRDGAGGVGHRDRSGIARAGRRRSGARRAPRRTARGVAAGPGRAPGGDAPRARACGGGDGRVAGGRRRALPARDPRSRGRSAGDRARRGPARAALPRRPGRGDRTAAVRGRAAARGRPGSGRRRCRDSRGPDAAPARRRDDDGRGRAGGRVAPVGLGRAAARGAVPARGAAAPGAGPRGRPDARQAAPRLLAAATRTGVPQPHDGDPAPGGDAAAVGERGAGLPGRGEHRRARARAGGVVGRERPHGDCGRGHRGLAAALADGAAAAGRRGAAAARGSLPTALLRTGGRAPRGVVQRPERRRVRRGERGEAGPRRARQRRRGRTARRTRAGARDRTRR